MVKDLLLHNLSEENMNNKLTIQEISDFFTKLFDFNKNNVEEDSKDKYFDLQNFGKAKGESINTNAILDISQNASYTNETNKI